MAELEQDLEGVKRLSRDLANASKTLTEREVRFLVDAYYQMQRNRITANNQVRSQSESKEPHGVLDWLAKQNETLELQIKRSLDKWSDGQVVGVWAKSVTGIGPVITAGLLSHIRIEEAPTAGHIWRYAGLDPTREWLGSEKAEKLVKQCLSDVSNNLDTALILAARIQNVKPERLREWATIDRDGNTIDLTSKSLTAALARRPHNGRLKTLCWKMGESFVKVSGLDADVYGKLYLKRKAYEQVKNDRGDYADQAEKIMASRRIGKSTEAYGYYIKGVLPPGHIHSRSKRWAVKIFLSHLHEFWFRVHFNREPPAPYPIAILGHVHKI